MGYKRYGSSDSIPTFNDDNNGEAVSNGILKNSSNKEIYFGIKKPKSAADSDKPWRELTTDDFDTLITCETGGCSATITLNTNDLTNKTGIIRYILSKNTTGSTRLITFNYKGTELFKINLDADSTTKYTVIWDLQNGNINGNTSSIQDVVNHGDTVSFSKYKPIRTNYIFNGWSSNISATSGSTVGYSAPITLHTTFYATWKLLSKTYTLNCIYVNNISNPLYAFLVNSNLSGLFTLSGNPLHNTCDGETSFVVCMDTTESLPYNFTGGANVDTLKLKYNYVSSSSYNGRIFFWNHTSISKYDGGSSFSTVTLKLSDQFKLYKKSVNGYTFTILSDKVYSFSKPDFTATITIKS